MKNLITYFSKFAPDNGSGMHRLWTDNGPIKSRKLFALLFCLLLVGVGNVWGTDYFSDNFSNATSNSNMTSRSGWASFTQCYNHYGSGVRLGTSSKSGSIKTAKIDALGTSGVTIVVRFSAKRWNTDATGLNISVSGAGTANVTNIPTLANQTSTSSAVSWDEKDYYEIIVTGATKNTQIEFATSASKRLILGNVSITSASDNTYRFKLVENVKDIGAGDYLIVYNNTNALNTHYGNVDANTYGTYTSISTYYTSSTKSIAYNSTTEALVYRAYSTTNGYALRKAYSSEFLGYSASSTGEYLRWDRNFTTSNDEWTLGVNSIVSYRYSSNAIRYNTGSPRFAIYAAANQSAVQLFKKEVVPSCTDLGTINGSVSWSGGNATVSWDAAGGCDSWALKYKRHADSDIPANWTSYAGSFGTATGRTSNSTAISGLTAGTEYDFQISGTSDGSVYCSGSVGQTVSSTVPKITTSSSMTDLGYQEGETPVAQTFTITGTQLTGNLTVDAPDYFLVSLDGSSWSSAGGTKSITVTTPPNNLGSTTIYVKAESGLSDGDNPSGNITISGGGAASVNVAVSATITEACTAPSSVSISGTTKYFGGQTISLTATPTGGVGEASYQWQKKVSGVWTDVANGNGISGATSNNLQISSCTHSNSGGYRCVVSTGSTCSTKSHADDNAGYGVHVYSIYGRYYNEGEWAHNEIAYTSGTTGTATVHLSAKKTYTFKVRSNNDLYYGNSSGNFIIQPATNMDCGTNNSEIRLFTTIEGDYTITVDIAHGLDNSPYVTIAVSYPSMTHPNSGYVYVQKFSWRPYLHYWYDNSNKLTEWGSDPQLNSDQYTSICGTEYWCVPVIDYYCNFIAKDAAGDPSNTTGDQHTNSPHPGQKLYNDGSWKWAAIPTYTISYAGGTGSTGSMSSESSIIAGSDQTLTAFNTITKAGYTFSCWHANQDVTIGGSTVSEGDDISDGATIQNVCGNITLTAQWTANTNTAYTVKHYQQNIANDDYTEVTGDRQNLTGTTDASVTPAVKSYTGFTAPSTQTVTILGDGSRVVDYYYTRNSYNLTWNLGGGTTTTAGTGIASGVSVNTTSSIKFGTSLTAPTVTKTGYGFSAWSPSAPASTMPAAATTYTATWSATNYTITYNLNSGTNPGGAPTGFTIESSEITLPTPTRAGYRFDGWYANVGLTGDVQTTIPAGSTGNKTYWAKWTAKTDTYKTGLHTGESGWTAYASGYTTNTSGAGYSIPAGAGNVAKGATSSCSDLHYVFAGWVADEYKASPDGHIISASGTTDATGTTYWAVWGDAVATDTYTRLTSIGDIDESAEYVLGIDGTGFHYSGTSSWGLTALPANQTPLYYTLTKEDAVTPTYFTAETSVSSTTYYLQVAGTGAFNMTTSSGTTAGQLVIGSTTNYGGSDKAYAVSVKGTTTKSLRRNGASGIRCYDNTTTGSLVFFYKVVPAGDIDYVTSCCELKPATSVTVASTTGTSATLSWTAPSPTTGISKLQVRNASDDAVLVDNLLVSATGATVTGLTECDEYTFYVASVGATCYTASESVDAQPYSGAKTVTYKYHDDVTPDGTFTTDCSHTSTTLPNPSRTGYTLKGWYTAADGGTKKGDGGASYAPDATITLHAQWTEKPKYTITLNAGNGTVSADGWTAGVSPTWSKTQTNGDEEITLPSASCNCAGWEFQGWATSSVDQAGAPSMTSSGTSVLPASNTTYYAVYRQNTPSGDDYTKITTTGELTTGYYVITGLWNGMTPYAMKGELYSEGVSLAETSQTVTDNVATQTTAAYVWQILNFGSYVAFKNKDTGKFLAIVDGKFALQDDGQKFTYSVTSGAWTFTSPSGKQIIYASRFNVADAQDKAIHLFRQNPNPSGNYKTVPSCSDYTITGVANPAAGGSVQLTAAAAKNGDKVWACYTIDEDYNFSNWSISGTGASLSSTSRQFTEITVGSANVTVTANFAAKVMYDITWKANGETLTGGDLGSASVRVEDGHNITALPPTPTSCETGSGKSENFIGWVVDDQNWSGKTNDLTGITIYKKVSEFPAVDDDVTYHAVWAATDESTNEWVKVEAVDDLNDGETVAFISAGDAYYLPNAASASGNAPSLGTVTKISGDINFVNEMKFTAIYNSTYDGFTFESVSATGKYLWVYNDNKGIYISATNEDKSTGSNIWYLEDFDEANSTSTGYGIGMYATTGEGNYRYLTTYGTSDWRSYKYTSVGTGTPVNILANIYRYAAGYKDYMTKCCEDPELEFTYTGVATAEELVRENKARLDAADEVVLTYTTSSSGTITDPTTASVYKLTTGGDGSGYGSRSTAGGSSASAQVGAISIDKTAKEITLSIKTTSSGGNTGCGTYRVELYQAAYSSGGDSYCEKTAYGFVDVKIKYEFIDAVNGNTTVVKYNTGSGVTFPTAGELSGGSDCHSETRVLKGWISETKLTSLYGGSAERVITLDDVKDAADTIIAPGADGKGIYAQGTKWYAVWAYEK